MMSVCVLMSTYNGEKFLKTQIDSILAQEGVKIQLLVRDDGSTDATHALLNKYQEKGLLDWYTGPNLRSAYSFWDLVERAPESSYYSFADQDDYWYPDKLSAAVTALKLIDGPALYFCKKRLVDAQLNPLNAPDEVVTGVTLPYSLLGCRAAGCTMVFNLELMQMLRLCKPRTMTMHDSWVLRVAGAVGQVVYDETSHMDYRQHGANVVGASPSRLKIWHRRFRSLYQRPKDDIRTRMAQQLYEVYHDYMHEPDCSALLNFSKIRSSFSARLHLIASDYLRTYEPNELPMAKLFVLLGWV